MRTSTGDEDEVTGAIAVVSLFIGLWWLLISCVIEMTQKTNHVGQIVGFNFSPWIWVVPLICGIVAGVAGIMYLFEIPWNIYRDYNWRWGPKF